MNRLPAKNKLSATQVNHSLGSLIGAGIKIPQTQYNNWFSDGVVMATSVLCVCFLFRVTLGF